jgi:hypothetical protein
MSCDKKIETLYHAARELDRDQQARFLGEARGSDAEIRSQIETSQSRREHHLELAFRSNALQAIPRSRSS